jgi:hypothetical protein
VLFAAGVAGLTAVPLPFAAEAPSESLDLAGTARPGEALAALTGALSAHPTLWIEAAVLAAASAAVPYARSHGVWGVAAWGGAFLAAALLAPWGDVPAFPTALWIWLGAAVVAVPVLRTRR